MFLIFLYICFSRASSVPSSPVAINKLHRSSTNPFFTNNIQPSKDPPKYDEAIKNRQVSTSFKSQFFTVHLPPINGGLKALNPPGNRYCRLKFFI